jgi:hypothetical protein
MMMEKLNAMGEGDFTMIFKMINSTASALPALAQLMPRDDDETQQMKPILNPKRNLNNINLNPDLSPRPGR